MTYKEAEAAILSLVRGMGEGDLIEGLGKLQMLQALDNMRGDWLAVLEANLPDEEPPQEAVNSTQAGGCEETRSLTIVPRFAVQFERLR